MYIEISEMCLKIPRQQHSVGPCRPDVGRIWADTACSLGHITVIEKNYIAIHIDIELLSSPR